MSSIAQREVAALLLMAERASDAGDLSSAGRLFDEILELDPGNSKAILYSAGIRQQAGDLDSAKSLLSKVDDEPSNFGATARYLEATIALAEHRSRDAELLLKRAGELNPNYQPPFRVLARLYALQMRGDELRETLDHLSKYRSLSIEELAMRLLAGRAFVEGSDAFLQLSQRVKKDPKDIQSIVAQARYLLKDGGCDAAVKLLESASTGLNDDVVFLCALALARDMKGSVLPDEKPELELTMSEASTAEAWELVLRQAAASGDWDRVAGIEQFRLSRDPFSPTISHSLATALDRLQKVDLAKTQHRHTELLDQLELLTYRIMSPRSKSPDIGIPIMCEIADLLTELSFNNEAAQWLLSAESLSPGRADVHSRLQRLKVDGTQGEVEQKKIDLPVLPKLVIRSGTRSVTANLNSDVKSWQFRDVAPEMGIHFEYCNGPTPYKRIVETIGGGAAVLDFDGDLWPDLYFVQGQALEKDGTLLNDCLFRNLRGVGSIECAVMAGIQEYGHSLAATVADFDNDGFPDVFVTNAGTSRLYHNCGDGTFEDVSPDCIRANVDCSSCSCFVDLNQDGFLDLFVVNYVAEWERRCFNAAGEFATCHPHDLPLAQNRLYQNLGNGEFSDATASSGLLGATGRGLGVITADFDCDGNADVFVANDGTPNMLFKSQISQRAIRFENPPDAIPAVEVGPEDMPPTVLMRNIGDQSGVAVPANGRAHAGMGVALSDFDENGFPDLFVTNFYREQNTLYSGLGCGIFADRSMESGLGFPSLDLLGFGTQAVDIDADGLEDLVVLNGDIGDYSATGRPWKMPMLLFESLGNGQFEDMSSHSGPEPKIPQLGRGLTRVDFDGDQAVDLAIVRHDGPVRLLKNETPQKKHGVRLRLISRASSRDSIGMSVILKSGENYQHRVVSSGDGFAASNERLLSFSVPSGSKCQLCVRHGHGECLSEKDWLSVDPSSQPLTLIVQQDGSAVIFKTPR